MNGTFAYLVGIRGASLATHAAPASTFVLTDPLGHWASGDLNKRITIRDAKVMDNTGTTNNTADGMSVNTITGRISTFTSATQVTVTVDTTHGAAPGTTINRWCRYVYGTDDTTALMSAYTAAAAAGGAIVYHPPGIYCTTSMLDFAGTVNGAGADGVRLLGAGYRTTRIVATSTANTSIDAVVNSLNNSDISLRELTLDGNLLTAKLATLSSGQGEEVVNVEVASNLFTGTSQSKNAGWSLHVNDLVGLGAMKNVVIQRNVFEYIPCYNQEVVAPANAEGVTIAGNILRDVNGPIHAFGCTNVSIAGNVLLAAQGEHSLTVGGHGQSATGNIIFRGSSCTISEMAVACEFVGNTVWDTPFLLTSNVDVCYDVTITGNHFSLITNTVTQAVSLGSCWKLVFSNNSVFANNGNAALRLNSGAGGGSAGQQTLPAGATLADVVISDNVIDYGGGFFGTTGNNFAIWSQIDAYQPPFVLAGCSMTAGDSTHTLTTSGAPFVGASSSNPQPLVIFGAGRGGLPLVCTITGKNSSSSVSVSEVCQTTVSGGSGLYGLAGLCSISDNIIKATVQSGGNGIYMNGGGDVRIESNVVKLNSGGKAYVEDSLAARCAVINNDFGTSTVTVLMGTGSLYRNNVGYNPVGDQGPITVGASPFTYTNSSGNDQVIYISGGSVVAVTSNGSPTGLSSGGFAVPAGRTLTVSYATAPAMRQNGM